MIRPTARQLVRALLPLLTLAAVALGACTEDDRCDSRTMFVDGVCRPRADGGGATSATFGMTCRRHEECAGPVVDVCLVPDGSESGVCSATGCDTKKDLCPVGWGCCDLAKIRPGSPWGCVPNGLCPP